MIPSWNAVVSEYIPMKFLEDFCDGTLFKNHPLFSKDPYAIPYYDELELCNPLGSHVKLHKVGVVFISLGNIHPIHRSQLKPFGRQVIVY